MFEHQLYLDMAAACIDELTHDERVSVPPETFAKIVRVCATVAFAQHRVDRDANGMPCPPAMGFVRGYMLQPGDAVWCPNAAYLTVDSVQVNGNTEEGTVIVNWVGGDTAHYGCSQLVRIAMNRETAADWNALRTEFEPDVLAQLARNFGNGR